MTSEPPHTTTPHPSEVETGKAALQFRFRGRERVVGEERCAALGSPTVPPCRPPHDVTTRRNSARGSFLSATTCGERARGGSVNDERVGLSRRIVVKHADQPGTASIGRNPLPAIPGPTEKPCAAGYSLPIGGTSGLHIAQADRRYAEPCHQGRQTKAKVRTLSSRGLYVLRSAPCLTNS